MSLLGSSWRTSTGEGPAFLDALTEPAAIASLDGRIEAANAPWREGPLAGRRLPASQPGLFAALVAARREGKRRGRLTVAGADVTVAVAALDRDRFLLRIDAADPPARPPRGGPTTDSHFAHSPFGAARIAGDAPFTGAILSVNDGLRALAGPGADVGGRLTDLLTPASGREAVAHHAAGRPGPFEVAPAHRPDRTAHLYLTGAPGETTAFLIDVTEQKSLQLQLAQRTKMEAIGQLAGGVAHDFNNLLTAIRLNVDELLVRHSLGDPSHENLSVISATVRRSADMVRQLLTFSRKATIQRETLELGEVIADFEVLLRRLLREDVRLETSYGPALPLIRADKAQLENAMINLVVNARDAIAAGGGGVIRLRVMRVANGESAALGGPAEGEMALIEVADDGPGMAPEVLANVFEPFFTTKAVGEGTGLGLATVYGIVKQADGTIIARSTPGEGAAFRIFLPAHVPPLSLETPLPARGRPAPRDLSGAGRILFVEDEPLVRRIAARLLRARGYEVLEAEHGEQALELAKAHAGAIDLMISDVIMPGMDGPTLLRHARPYLGDAPVMFVSGYAEAEFSDLLEGEAGVSFLPKPLDIKSLAEQVKLRLRGA